MILKIFHHIHKTNKVHYCTKSASNNKLFSNTVLLPKTSFPLRLEGKKLVERDQHIYDVAEFENLYDWQRSHLNEPEFVLHDGPPYANGQPHMGHAINKILKDTVLRYHILNGNKVHFVPGWDCHGLPIELKAISNSSEMDPLAIRTKARNFAQETINKQQEMFKAWGVIGNWKNYYTTFSVDYIKIQFRQFFRMYEKNLIYRDFKPIFWSPSSKTALAEAELEYNENHKSPSAFVRFQIKDIPKIDLLKGKRVYGIIWTTTPWTLPSNQIVCYNESLHYCLVKKPDIYDTDIYIVAADLLENISAAFNCNFQLLNVMPGNLLEGVTYIHPIYKEKVLPFLNSSHARADKGTGLVHTAPAHGPDDFLVALKHKLPVVDMITEQGCYKTEAGQELEGKFVLSEGTEQVLQLIRNDLMQLGEIIHSYPYDWRTKKPVIIRASQQWFVDTGAIKDRAAELLENVKIIPKDKSDIYRRNLLTQILKRPYWCISRQRKWGVPIPVFYDKSTSKIIINGNTINHHCNLLEQHGTDFWWKLQTKDLLPEDEYSSNLDDIVKGEDIMDIWFDSGISWANVLDGVKVADMCLEGVDQCTGWFQSSLLTSVALRDKAPYKSLYVHGFAVDENGVKMSKSIGNVIDPIDITSGKKGQKPYGVDVLRWWVACHANKVALANVSTNVLQCSADEVQKVRSVLRFALGSLWDYEKSDGDQKNLLIIDRYILHLLYQFHQQVKEFTEDYQFHKISFITLNLLTNPISALYYTAIKDRLYCDHVDSSTRRNAQYVLLQIFEIVTQSIGPIVPHLVEEMYLHLPQKDNKTYFTSSHPKPGADWEDFKVEQAMNVILDVRRNINKEAEATIAADVTIIFPKTILNLLQDLTPNKDLHNQLVDILQVASVTVVEDNINEDYKIEISKTKNLCCPRCRRLYSGKENDLCKRCYDVINTLKDNKKAAAN